jgi:hypothetical protein
MPRKPKAKPVDLPAIPAELLEQFGNGPMTADGINAATLALKKALIERITADQDLVQRTTVEDIRIDFHKPTFPMFGSGDMRSRTILESQRFGIALSRESLLESFVAPVLR